MKKEHLTIEVSDEVFELAKSEKLNVITAHLDPAADKELQEGTRPREVTLKARGTKKDTVSFSVIGSDTVHKGYTVTTKSNRALETMSRNTGRVVIGTPIPAPKVKDNESLPEKSR